MALESHRKIGLHFIDLPESVQRVAIDRPLIIPMRMMSRVSCILIPYALCVCVCVCSSVSAIEYAVSTDNLNLSAIRTVRVLRPIRAINRIPSQYPLYLFRPFLSLFLSEFDVKSITADACHDCTFSGVCQLPLISFVDQ